MKVFVHYSDGTQEEIKCDGVEAFSFVVKDPVVEETAPVDVPVQEVAPATEDAPVIEEETAPADFESEEKVTEDVLEDEGMPRYQVNRFQKMAPTRAASTSI